MKGGTLIAFGGGGPVHACRVAEKVGISRVLVPSGAGVGSAIGFLRAPVGYEVVRSLYQRFSTFDVAAVNDLLDDMRQEAEAAVAKGSFGAPTVETRTAYMRYVGQGHEIPVPLPNRVLEAADVALIRARYDEEYARFFDRPVPGSDVEIMSYAVVVTTVTAEIEPPPSGGPRAGVEACRGADATGARHDDRGGVGLGDLRPGVAGGGCRDRRARPSWRRTRRRR